MTEHRYILELYEGINTRYDCPNCGKHKEFTRYTDTQTGEHLADNVGICNRKIECGYHYPPKQYFENNKHLFNSSYTTQIIKPKGTTSSQPKPISFIPVILFKASLNAYMKNHFVTFLCSLFGPEITNRLIEKYFIGTSKHWGTGASIFWQIDIAGNIRTGKIMLYNPDNGKRVKEPFDHFYWVHNELKKTDFTCTDYFEPSFDVNKQQKEYNLKQCFFGEHLLKDNTNPVLIFESEKTAIISSIYFPNHICLACGGLDGFNYKKCGVLQGRQVVLYPDLSKPDTQRNCYKIWSEQAKEFSLPIPGVRFRVSDLLERKATEAEKKQGLDIADYLIRFNYRGFQEKEQLNKEPSLTQSNGIEENHKLMKEPETTINSLPASEVSKGYVDEEGKLYIPTPMSDTYTVRDSIEHYNKRIDSISFIKRTDIDVTSFKVVLIDRNTLTIPNP